MVALAIITGTIWYGISYGSPCRPTPPPAQQSALQPQPVPSTLIIFSSYQLFPQLWCPAGEYSVFGQVSCPLHSLQLRIQLCQLLIVEACRPAC